jgi:MauM/NapG family ferredoxin protein
MPRDWSRRELFSIWRTRLGELGAERKGDEADAPPAAPAPTALPWRIWLRPPGAAPEAVLADLCTRCSKCVTVCPREAIFGLPASYGRDAGTPAILARRAPCVMCDGLECTRACPSGALSPLLPVDVKMGTAVVDRDRCVTFHGQPCEICHGACPVRGALRLEWGQPIVEPSLCTGCGACENACPTDPTSIFVDPQANP